MNGCFWVSFFLGRVLFCSCCSWLLLKKRSCPPHLASGHPSRIRGTSQAQVESTRTVEKEYCLWEKEDESKRRKKKKEEEDGEEVSEGEAKRSSLEDEQDASSGPSAPLTHVYSFIESWKVLLLPLVHLAIHSVSKFFGSSFFPLHREKRRHKKMKKKKKQLVFLRLLLCSLWEKGLPPALSFFVAWGLSSFTRTTAGSLSLFLSLARAKIRVQRVVKKQKEVYKKEAALSQSWFVCLFLFFDRSCPSTSVPFSRGSLMFLSFLRPWGSSVRSLSLFSRTLSLSLKDICRPFAREWLDRPSSFPSTLNTFCHIRDSPPFHFFLHLLREQMIQGNKEWDKKWKNMWRKWRAEQTLSSAEGSSKT